MFKKTLLLVMLVFCTTYLWFNFSFVSLRLASLVQTAPEEIAENVNIEGQVYLFPISSDSPPKVSSTEDGIKEGPRPVKTGDVATVPLAGSFRLSIPSLSVQAPIVFEPTKVESRIYSALERGVVHYASTPQPGQSGTSIIIGHSSVYPWYKGKYGQVFSSLSSLQAGDIINIEKEGQFFSYRVTKSLIFSPQSPDDYALRELETTDGSSLVLMTCWPTGTNSKRVAVRADLII